MVPPRRAAWPIFTAPLPAMLDIAPAQQRNVIVRPHGARRDLHPARRSQGRSAPSPRPRRVSHPRDLARQFSGLARAAGHRGQGLRPPPAQGHRRRSRPRAAQRASPAASTSRTNTRPTFRAWRSVRRIPAAWRVPTSSNGSAWWRHRSPSSRSPFALPPPVFPPRQPQMAELRPLRGRRTAQQRRKPAPTCQPGGFRVLHDRDHLGLERRRDGRAADGGKRQGAGQRQSYAELTARNAALAVERRRQQPRQTGEHSRR